jgi:Tol biopolymer transport system component
MALYIQDVYSTEAPQRIVGGELTQDLVLSPSQITANGKYLVIDEQDPQTDWDIILHKMDNNGGFADLVYLKTEFTEGGAQVSPDGRWIAYGSSESGTGEVYVSTFPEYSAKWQVSNSGGFFSEWSPDGRRIYYKDLDGMINVVDVDGSGASLKIGRSRPLRKIGDGPLPWFQIFREEKKLLTIEYVAQNQIDEMILVQNWPEQLKK